MKSVASACLFGGALLGAGLSSPAAAGVMLTGTLFQATSSGGDDYGSFAYSVGPTTIDTFDFTVLSDGNVQFDMLSYQVFTNWIDPMVFVFTNNGEPPTAVNLVDYNDDYDGADLNGSVDSLDSFLELFLTAGEYTVAVGSYETFIHEIASGITADGIVLDGGGNGLPTEGRYQLDIFGDVVIPAPGALALLGLGGLTATRRRR